MEYKPDYTKTWSEHIRALSKLAAYLVKTEDRQTLNETQDILNKLLVVAANRKRQEDA